MCFFVREILGHWKNSSRLLCGRLCVEFEFHSEAVQCAHTNGIARSSRVFSEICVLHGISYEIFDILVTSGRVFLVHRADLHVFCGE